MSIGAGVRNNLIPFFLLPDEVSTFARGKQLIRFILKLFYRDLPAGMRLQV